MNRDVRALRRLDTLIDDVEREGHRTDRTLRRLPSRFFDYRPSNELPPAGEVINHIAAVYLSLSQALRIPAKVDTDSGAT